VVSIKEKIKFNYKSLEFIVLAILIISMTVVYIIPTSKRIVPMGPIVGGDLYAHVGAVRSIRTNWTPWIDQYYDSGIARAYSWLWHLLMAVLSLAIPLTTLLLWTPLVFWILSLIGIYFAGKWLYGKKFGLLLAMFFFVMVDESLINPNPKNFLIVSLFLSIALLYKAFESKKILHAVIAGVVMALAFMNYSMLIVLPAVPILYVILNLVFKKYKKEKDNKDNGNEHSKAEFNKKDFLNDLKVAAIVVALAIIISIPYWLPIVTSFNLHAVQTQSISSSVEQHEGSPFFTRIYEIFFGFILHYWYFIPFFIAGLIFIFTNFNKKSAILISFLIIFYLGRFHDYLTRPLLGWEGVQPFYFPYFINYVYWIIIVLGFLALLNKLVDFIGKQFKNKKADNKSTGFDTVEKTALIIILVVALVIGNVAAYQYLNVGPDNWKNYVTASYQPLPKMFTEPAAWVSQNTNDKDVITAHPFYAFGIFGLTGRHIYASMYGHMLSLVDDNDRRRDAQEIYTTSNITRALELLANRKATYLIVDPYAADKSQWFQVNQWAVIEGKEPMPTDERNVTKFFNNPHFQSVYNYTEVMNSQRYLVVSIFKIVY